MQPIKIRNEASRPQNCRVGDNRTFHALVLPFFCSVFFSPLYWYNSIDHPAFNATLRKRRVLSYCRNLFRSPSRVLGWWSQSREFLVLCQSASESRRLFPRTTQPFRKKRRELKVVTDPASPRCSHHLAARPGNVLQSGAFVKTACVHARHRHFSKAEAFSFFRFFVFSIQGPETFGKLLVNVPFTPVYLPQDVFHVQLLQRNIQKILDRPSDLPVWPFTLRVFRRLFSFWPALDIACTCRGVGWAVKNKQQTAEQGCCFFHTVCLWTWWLHKSMTGIRSRSNNSIKVALVYFPGVGLVEPNSPWRLAMKNKIQWNKA